MSPKEIDKDAAAVKQTAQTLSVQDTSLQMKSIGSDDFRKLRENDAFIDKSLFIKDVLYAQADVILITRPRRWGKSSNLNMLKTFLEIEVDEKGNELAEADKINPKYFQGGQLELEEGAKTINALKITSNQSVMKMLGKYPVILLNFKDINCTSYETTEAGINNIVSKAFKAHAYLSKSEKVEQYEKNQIYQYLSGDIDMRKLQNAIADLMEYLHKHFQKKVWVLIDEYDNAIYNAYLKFGTTKENPNEFTDDFQGVLSLFRSLMGSALKSNPNLAKGVLTGILKIAKADLLSGLNNLIDYNVLDEEFSPYYGFTQQEVDDLLSKWQVGEDKKEMIKSWYNGYSYGGLTLYNPWSIMRHLAKLQTNRHAFPQNYWADSGAFGVLQNLFLTDELQTEIQTLLSQPHAHITASIHPNIDLASLHTEDLDMALSLLLFTGYLNPINQETSFAEIDLGVPNQEVRSSFGELIRKWAAKKLSTDESKFGPLERALIAGNIDVFKNKLSIFLGSNMSFSIVKALSIKESHYHFLMMGILGHSMHKVYHIFHELESGAGYVDSILIPRESISNKDQAIILEYKYAKDENSLLKDAQGALEQIREKHYDGKLKGGLYPHVKSILKVGIAFHKKDAEVIYTVETL